VQRTLPVTFLKSGPKLGKYTRTGGEETEAAAVNLRRIFSKMELTARSLVGEPFEKTLKGGGGHGGKPIKHWDTGFQLIQRPRQGGEKEDIDSSGP